MITENPKWLPDDYYCKLYEPKNHQRKGGQHVPISNRLMTMDIVDQWNKVVLSASIRTRSQHISRVKLEAVLELMFNEGNYTRL